MSDLGPVRAVRQEPIPIHCDRCGRDALEIEWERKAHEANSRRCVYLSHMNCGGEAIHACAYYN